MAAAMLCGDEVASAVVDIGGAYCKFGSAGQDCPPHVFRSDVGCIENENSKSYRIGDSALRIVDDTVEVSSPYSTEGIYITLHLTRDHRLRVLLIPLYRHQLGVCR